MSPESIHTPDDGRGPRDVYLNGQLIHRVMYADTKRGIVRCVHAPPRVDTRSNKVLSFMMR